MMMMSSVVSATHNEPAIGFGPHLMLDCRQCDYDKINSLDVVYNFLNELPELVGMTKIIPPYVFPYSGLIPEDKGITGMVIIAESHLTFHSFVEKDYFFFDMFSCKPFDVAKVEQHVIETFGVKSYERFYSERGRYFPRGSALHLPEDMGLTATQLVEEATAVSV
ncbi:MAG: S-adenosylmethionine decarboxylase [Vampirovibrionales bacterium]